MMAKLTVNGRESSDQTVASVVGVGRARDGGKLDEVVHTGHWAKLFEGSAPDISMERLTLSEDSERKGVFGLRIRISGREQFMFFTLGARVLLPGHQAHGAGRLSPRRIAIT